MTDTTIHTHTAANPSAYPVPGCDACIAAADATYLAARATFLDAVDGKTDDATNRAAYEVYAAASKTYLGR